MALKNRLSAFFLNKYFFEVLCGILLRHLFVQ